mmetsp:Transcript_11577/g.18833  ORF Transcript_11577/g.18833 Transcript_11577/m.18833 type:complete len:128 (-) Transcript_11577:2071-2454(-)
MMILSPGFAVTVFLEPRSWCILLDMRMFCPVLPGLPPCIPYGLKALRSESMESVTVRRNSISRMIPSPPLKSPSPPDCLRRENSRSTTGYLFSNISGSVMRVFVMWVCTPDRPCHDGPAPAPPAMVS